MLELTKKGMKANIYTISQTPIIDGSFNLMKAQFEMTAYYAFNMRHV